MNDSFLLLVLTYLNIVLSSSFDVSSSFGITDTLHRIEIFIKGVVCGICMEKKEVVFSVAFVGCLGVLLFFLGSSITGLITQTMFCENGVCRKLCRTDYDCVRNELCCNHGGIGVCEELEDCAEPYVLQPDVEVDTTQMMNRPAVEQPSSARQSNTVVLFVLIALAITIGLFYLFMSSNHKTTPTPKKRTKGRTKKKTAKAKPKKKAGTKKRHKKESSAQKKRRAAKKK